MLNPMTTRSINIFRRLGLTLLMLLGLVLAIMVLALQLQPSVSASRALDNVDINTIEQLIVDNAPERISTPGERIVHLDRGELNLLTAFALQTVPGMRDVAAEVSLQAGNARVDVAAPVRLPFATFYLNLSTQLLARERGVEIGSVRAGNLPIPITLVNFAREVTQRRLANSYVNYQELADLQRNVRQVTFEDEAIVITLDWEPSLIASVQNQAEQLLLRAEDRERILQYYTRIEEVVAQQPEGTRSVSLTTLLAPLFATARGAVAAGADPITENRTLLQALSLYVNETAIRELTGEEISRAEWRRRVRVTIQRRPDLAQHFTTSAAITASSGAGVAGILYNSKEVHDARYRTGFSFSDLTANIAGVTFGDVATATAEGARRLQNTLLAQTEEADYMPPVSRDNAGITEEDFSQQYQDRNSEAYRERVAAIERQISELPLYSQGPHSLSTP